MDQQNAFEKLVIKVVGISNSGKTMVVMEIDRLINVYYDNIETIVPKTKLYKNERDYYKIIKINNHIIALCTFCDIPDIVEDDFFPNFEEHNCDLVIMTCRTKGKVKEALINEYTDYRKVDIKVNYKDGNDIPEWKSFMSVKEDNIKDIMKLIDEHLKK